MPRPESPLRDGDIVEMVMQKKPKEKPNWSIVARLFDDEGKEHLYVGIANNPSQWVRWMRYGVDNPYVPPVEDE